MTIALRSLALLLLCLLPLNLSQNLALAANDDSTNSQEPLVLAILEFEAVNEEARRGNKGRMVSEIFTTAAVQAGLQVVERHMIRKVLDEMEYGDGAFSGTAAQKIGIILGANAVLTGSVSEFMGDLRIDARLINVADGAILLADGGQAELDLGVITQVVVNLMRKMVAALHGEAPADSVPGKGASPSLTGDGDTSGPMESLLPPARVTASSVLPDSKNFSYGPEHLLDGNHATVWVEGAKDNGQGQWVKFFFDTTVTVSRIDFVNGYNRINAGQDRWQQNGRVRTLRVSFSNGQSKDIQLADSREPQSIELSPTRTDWLLFTILDSYPGAKWPNDTCLAEISVYGLQ